MRGDACWNCRTDLVCPRHAPTEAERRRAEALVAVFRESDARDLASFEDAVERLCATHGVLDEDQLPAAVRRQVARCVHDLLDVCPSGARPE